MKLLLSACLSAFILCFSFDSYSQVVEADTTLRLIEKIDGTKYIAKILSDDARELLIETESIGRIYILKSDVKRITMIEDKTKIINGEFREDSPFSTRYAFTNNALPIKKNEHYAMVNLFGPEVHFAVSDQLNIGVMTTWIGSPLVAVGKYTIPTANEKLNFSIASMIGTSGYLNQFRGFGGLHWATMTFGDRKNNLSISGGFGYFNAGNRNETWDEGGFSVSYGARNQDVVGNYTTTNGQWSTYTDYQYDPVTDVFTAVTFDYYDYDTPYVPREKVRNTFKAPILSLAGIRQLTNKASLFFDSMIAFGVSDFTTTNRSGGREYIYDEVGNVIEVTSSPKIISVKKSSPVALYFMPGMRFQKNDQRAFQIAIAGITVWNDGEVSAFPLPLISWFFKF
tara:strand:- start:47339 stop:48529 length:1191 start_codon:yes stop_codon:yes gene_type:complete